ncbi:Hsp20/alpha crystallin family protein [Peribacillus glennii]|uniref:Hsp20/alpha crystallin family protein n=2 Tax=Peribacillus glennii TaxID=2303991 RepID=A0A372LIF3_9BACI|nr:Hsp20/alpha crystallin family protein [Peribacillus glennii]
MHLPKYTISTNELKGGTIMDMEKLKQWIELSQSYQSEQFWRQVFSQKNGEAGSSHFDQSFFQGPKQRVSEWPLYDMYLYNGVIWIIIEIPGIRPEEIQLSIQEDTLVVSGNITTIMEGIHYYVKERRNQKFERKIKLPDLPDIEKPQFRFQHGLIIVTYPIREDEPVQIDIAQQEA